MTLAEEGGVNEDREPKMKNRHGYNLESEQCQSKVRRTCPMEAWAVEEEELAKLLSIWLQVT